MTCKDKTNLAHLHITQIISSCLSGRLKFRLIWPISTHACFSSSSFLLSGSLLHSSVFLFFRVEYCMFSEAVDFFTVPWLTDPKTEVEGHVQRSWPPGECLCGGCYQDPFAWFLFFLLRCAGVKTVEVLCPDWNILWVCLCHYVIFLISFAKCKCKWHYNWLQLILREFPIVYKQIFFTYQY